MDDLPRTTVTGLFAVLGACGDLAIYYARNRRAAERVVALLDEDDAGP